jgi:rhodanese-related sulfurtransferase
MAGKSMKDYLAEANARIDSISVHDALGEVGAEDILFVDVRESDERAKTGAIPGSVHVPRGFLEFQADPDSPMHNPALSEGKTLILYCASGGRSALSANTMMDMGYGKVLNLVGGLSAWQQAQGPIEPAD